MEWLHPTVRTIYFAVLLISAGALAVQSLGRTLHGRLACALVGCVAFAILAGHEGILDLLGRGAWPVVAIGSLTAFVFWLTANSFFVDGFRLRQSHLAIGALVIALASAQRVVDSPTLRSALDATNLLLGFAFVLHGIGRVWLSHARDLDPARLRFRARFAALPLTYLAIVALAESVALFGNANAAERIGFANSVFLGTSAAYLGLLLHHYVTSRSARSGEVSLEPPSSFAATLDADAKSLLTLVHEQFDRRRIYTDDQLTLAGLSHALDVPIGDLRSLLFQAYGYRDFNKLLDGFRVEAAKSYLGDVDEAQMPLVDIAAMVGYRSTAALTQAFLAIEKELPLTYRQRAIDKNSAAPRLQLTNTDR